jgi:MoaA/NifB/PqqE/SkfB family radical SAM enzyme
MEISPELFEHFCRDLGGMGSHVVLFVGAGEPALHSQFLRLVESTRRHKLRATVYTNGTLFTKYSSADLVNSGLDLIRFSLSEFSADTYASNHPYLKPGTYERNWDAVGQLSHARKALHRRYPRLELCIPMDRDNMLHLDRMVDLAVAAGMDRVHFSVVLDFNQEGLKPYMLTPQETGIVREQLEKIRPRLAALKLDNNVDDVLLRYRIGRSVRTSVPCYSGWFYSFLDTGGKVKVCQRDTGVLGDLREQSFALIWNGPTYRAFRRQARNQEFFEGEGRRIDCSFCPHLANNHRVDRVYRLIAPFIQKDKSFHP